MKRIRVHTVLQIPSVDLYPATVESTEDVYQGYIWQLVDEQEMTVAEYRHGKLSGLLLLGDISYDRLKSIPLRRIAALVPRDDLATWDYPPTREDVLEARLALRVSKRVTNEQLVRRLTKKHLNRKPNETPAEHYKRVADFYLLAASSSGKPLVRISEAADVPKSTAARWVREARKLGYLPATTRGKV